MESNVFNELIVVKRSGQRVTFNPTKIAIAIKKAFDSVYNNYDSNDVNRAYSGVLDYISNNYQERKTINVEDIQDIIENVLKEQKFTLVYTSFNNYRLKRAASRELFDRKQQHKFVKATEKLVLTAQDENSSKPMDVLFNFGKTISNEFSKAYLIDSKYVRNHEEGNIFIHNLDYYVLGSTLSSHLDLSHIKNYENYFDEITEILLNIKKEQYGEHTLTSIDYLFVPYLIYKFKKIFIENLRYSFKLEGLLNYIKFSDIEDVINNLDDIYINMSIFDKYIYNEKVSFIFKTIYDDSLDKLSNILYTEIKKLLLTLNKMDCCLNTNYGYSISLGTNNNNIGKFITNTYFKIIGILDRLDNVTTIYKVKNQSTDILDELSKLIIENKNIAISNVSASYNKKYITEGDYKKEIEYFSNGNRILENYIDKNQISVGRIILNKTSINLVRIALKSKNIKEFYEYLNEIMELIKNELLQTFEYQSNKYKENFKYLFDNNIVLDSEKLEGNQRIRKVIKNGTLNIGYVGLKECISVLQKKDILDIEDLKLSIDIVKFMKEKCDKFEEENKLNFRIFETYSKDILKYFLNIDRTIYSNIKNITDKDTYTTYSTIFDELDISLSDRFKIEGKLQKYSNGGYYEIMHIPKKCSYKKITEIITLMKEFDIGYLKFIIGKQYEN